MHVYPNYYKKHFHNYKNCFFIRQILKKRFVLLNIRMINLSFDELRLIAQIRNISDYENKSKEDLIKALSEPKPKPEPKLEPKPQTPRPETKPKPQTSKTRNTKIRTETSFKS